MRTNTARARPALRSFTTRATHERMHVYWQREIYHVSRRTALRKHGFDASFSFVMPMSKVHFAAYLRCTDRRAKNSSATIPFAVTARAFRPSPPASFLCRSLQI
eukprot:IDg22301t1